MRIPDKAVREFQELWKIQFGEDLDDPKARAFAEQFLDVMKIVLKPIPQNK